MTLHKKEWCHKHNKKFWSKWKKWVIIFFALRIKDEHLLSKKTYILQQAKQYYENNKERFQEQARNIYRKLSGKIVRKRLKTNKD